MVIFKKKKKKSRSATHIPIRTRNAKERKLPISRKLSEGRKDGRTLIHKILPAGVQLEIEDTNIERADKVIMINNILQRTNCQIKKSVLPKILKETNGFINNDYSKYEYSAREILNS